MMPILLYSCENWLAVETVGVISGRDREEDSGSAKVYIQYSIGYGNGWPSMRVWVLMVKQSFLKVGVGRWNKLGSRGC